MICLIGESGSGKSSIEKYLCDKHGLKKVVSYTTRPPRQGEVDGVDYHFITEEEFFAMKDNNEFAETTKFRDWYYGATIKELQNKDVFVIEPIGLKTLLDRKEELNLNLTPIYIYVAERVRMIRMLERGDDVDEVIRRVHNDRETFAGVKDLVQFKVFNGVAGLFEYTAGEVLNIYRMNS